MPTYLEENLDNVIKKIKLSKKKKLSIWDIDDTLFSTPTEQMKIVVLDKKTKKPLKRNGKEVTMNSHEFANKEIREKIVGDDGFLEEPGSYKSFRDAGIFSNHAKPIKENFDLALKEYDRKSMFFLVLTARGNMAYVNGVKTGKAKSVFLEHFNKHGLNMNSGGSHIVRTASVTNLPGGLGKKNVIKNILEAIPEIDYVALYDDSTDNINQFKTLRNEFPERRITYKHKLIEKKIMENTYSYV